MDKITVAELIEMLEKIEDKTQAVEVWDKSVMEIRSIDFICESVCGGLDIHVDKYD